MWVRSSSMWSVVCRRPRSCGRSRWPSWLTHSRGFCVAAQRIGGAGGVESLVDLGAGGLWGGEHPGDVIRHDLFAFDRFCRLVGELARPIQHIVKLAEPHFGDAAFDRARLDAKVDHTPSSTTRTPGATAELGACARRSRRCPGCWGADNAVARRSIAGRRRARRGDTRRRRRDRSRPRSRRGRRRRPRSIETAVAVRARRRSHA